MQRKIKKRVLKEVVFFCASDLALPLLEGKKR